MSDGLAQILHPAHTAITDVLTLLRSEAQRIRDQHTAAAAEQRQLQRTIDEISVQRSFAEHLNNPNLERLRQQEQALRERRHGLEAQTTHHAEALKRLEQLMRQIEMSSTTLTGVALSAGNDDPWALALRSQIIHGREEERVRLAREVHDGPAQVMANVLMGLAHAINLHASQHPQLPDFLNELQTAARQGLHEVRSFIADLRPGALDKGLPAALQQYVETYQRSTGIIVHLDLHQWNRPISTDAEIVLYRVVQEALQNINKHARQAHVQIRSFERANEVVVMIRDDGPGFNPRDVLRRAGKESWGLTSMRERLALVGGYFAIASRPGTGTEVTLRIPFAG